MSGLFTSLFNATGALQVYGRVFNVIQNNITNIHTPGYVRQDQSLISAAFNPAESLPGGLLAGPLLSARSQYLERAVRYQQQLLGAAEQKAADLSRIESLFDLSGRSGVPGALGKFFDSFSQLSVNPNNATGRQQVIDAAAGVAQAFQENALGITQVSGDLETQIRFSVDVIAQAATEVAEINRHFRANSHATQDAGLDARLHAALESLSKVVDFAALRADDGTISVYLGGQTPLVIGDHSFSVTPDLTGTQALIRDSQGNDITGQLAGRGGSLGTLLEERNIILPGYLASLNNIAQVFADTVNTALAQGIDLSGNAPTIDLLSYSAGTGAASSLSVTGIVPDQIAAASSGAPGGNGNAIALAQLAGQPVLNGFTFIQAYGNLGGGVGHDVSSAQQDREAQKDLVVQAQQQRADVSGVSLDAEAVKLLQFQQNYQAVGKLVTVLDDLTRTVMSLIP